MIQDLFDHRLVFDVGDDLHDIAALVAGFGIDVEHAFTKSRR